MRSKGLLSELIDRCDIGRDSDRPRRIFRHHIDRANISLGDQRRETEETEEEKSQKVLHERKRCLMVSGAGSISIYSHLVHNNVNTLSVPTFYTS